VFDISHDGIAEIIMGGGSETVEFKSRLPKGDIIARILVSFANTEGGILLVGVSEDGKVIGIPKEYVKDTLYLLRKVASSLLPYSIQSGDVNIHGAHVIYAIIPKAPNHLSPVMTSHGEIYHREGVNIVRVKNERFQAFVPSSQLPSITRKEVVVFVAMSFRDEEEPALVDYYRAIERAVKATKLPLKLNRVDLVEGDYEISQRIMDEIDRADVVISDFTLNSRNVYFELGYARGIKKRIIQSARKGTELEFDIKTWRTLFYRNATELEEKLIPALKTAYADIVANDAS
jgi:schlafen family protein